MVASAGASNTPELSIVVPCYNEQECLEALFARVEATFGSSGIGYELVLVDDGSADRTWPIICRLVGTSNTGKIASSSVEAQGGSAIHQDAPRAGARVVGIQLSRNFGKESALMAGLAHAHGACVGLMDADLQQTPETLLEMYRQLQAHPEADCVAAYQSKRHEGAVQAKLKRAFYRVFNAMTERSVEMVPDASDFRVFRREVAEALLAMPEYHRFSKGLFAWIGFETLPFPYEPSERFAGASKWSLRKLMRYATDGILAFSTMPLKLATWVGALCALAAVVYFFMVLWDTYGLHNTPSGYPTIVCLILLIGGLALLTLGIIGEYVARIYIEDKRRPVYIARRIIEGEARPGQDEHAGAMAGYAQQAIPASEACDTETRAARTQRK